MATHEEITKAVIAIAAKSCKADEGSITPETRWLEDLNAKSVYATKTCALIKIKLGCDFSMKELAGCTTIQDTIDLVEQKLDE